MADLLITLLENIFEFLSFYMTMHAFKKLPFYPKKKDFFFAILMLFVLYCVFPYPPLVSFLCGQLLLLIYCISCYEKNFLQGMLLFCLTIGYLMILQFGIVFIFDILHVPMPAPVIGILGSLFTLILSIFIPCFTPVSNLYHIIKHSAFPYRLIFIDTYLIFISILVISKLDNTISFLTPSYILTSLTLLLPANACLLYYDFTMQKQKQELLSYQQNMAIYESLIHEIRSNQHEYTNRIQTLQTLPLTCKDYTSICEALQHNTKQYMQPLYAYPLLCIDKPLLAAGLYNLAYRAEKNGISVQFDVNTEHLTSQAPEYKLSDFCCILLQNAIEACHSGDKVYVHLSSENGKTLFEVRNPVQTFIRTENLKKFFQKGYTTKIKQPEEHNPPHGYGLYNLLRSVNRLNGIIDSECAEYKGTNWIIFQLEV